VHAVLCCAIKCRAAKWKVAVRSASESRQQSCVVAGSLAGCTHSATSLSRAVPSWISRSAVSLNCVVLVEFACIVDVY
jgi:hypothetical protein